MKEGAKITLSETSLLLAEKRARANGFKSVSEYITALIEDDRQNGAIHDWMRQRINEGLASPSAGEITASRIKGQIEALDDLKGLGWKGDRSEMRKDRSTSRRRPK